MTIQCQMCGKPCTNDDLVLRVGNMPGSGTGLLCHDCHAHTPYPSGQLPGEVVGPLRNEQPARDNPKNPERRGNDGDGEFIGAMVGTALGGVGGGILGAVFGGLFDDDE